MTGDNSEVETANGNFYRHYRKGLVDFLEFTQAVGLNAISSGKLQGVDKSAVEHGLDAMRRPTEDLIKLLEKKIDVENPTFFDECTIESIWSALGAVFLIAQHSGFTDSAKVYAHTAQSATARAGKKKKDDVGKAGQIELITGSKMYHEDGQVKVAALATDTGLSPSTVRRRLKDLRQA